MNKVYEVLELTENKIGMSRTTNQYFIIGLTAGWKIQSWMIRKLSLGGAVFHVHSLPLVCRILYTRNCTISIHTDELIYFNMHC